MEFWLGNTTLDRHVLLAVHGLRAVGLIAITARTRKYLVATKHVYPACQILPDSQWIRGSLTRLISDGYVKLIEAGCFSPNKRITDGWP